MLVNNISPIERALANAHMIFNVSGVLIFAWTIPFFEKILNKLIPEKIAS
jgi:phosphate:Na+ symporter